MAKEHGAKAQGVNLRREATMGLACQGSVGAGGPPGEIALLPEPLYSALLRVRSGGPKDL